MLPEIYNKKSITEMVDNLFDEFYVGDYFSDLEVNSDNEDLWFDQYDETVTTIAKAIEELKLDFTDKLLKKLKL